jgi:hypothetical protein
VLYKYCDFNGFDILLNSRLKASSFDELNDPFELQFGPDTDKALTGMRGVFESPEHIEALKEFLVEQGIPFNKDSIEDVLAKGSEHRVKNTSEIIKSIRDGWRLNMGVICLSRTNDSVQMWSHYADNHKGIVVGFDENEISKDPRALVEIDYKAEMVRLPVAFSQKELQSLTPLYKQLLVDVLRTKEQGWAYEKEVRVYSTKTEINADGKFYYPLKSGVIKEIYLGWKASELAEYTAKALKADKYPEVKIFKMHVGVDAFKLLPQVI